MILIERQLDVLHTVTLEHDPVIGLQVSVVDKSGVIEWVKHPTEGKEALQVFYHPFGYGYEESSTC